jgi:tRNA-specific 2-thiouridylase
MKKKVVIAMSGGVDSSVCAAMMVQEGHECVGMTMRLWKGAEAETASCSSQSCCGAESVEDARLVCETVGIPYYAINFKQEFWDNVVKVFAEEYFAGRTPSPCILCNEKMKFDTLYKKAVEIGAEKICTGHYARIEFDESSQRWHLLRGVDPKKDQSYFLFSMTQEQLSKTWFPLGGYTKDKIRELAHAANLVTAAKPESMDICFIPNGDYAAFLERHFPHMIPKENGSIKHVDGRELGQHQGIHTVTIGQRKGVGIAFGEPLYVTGINPKTNEVTVGPRQAVLSKEFTISRVNWIVQEPSGVDETFSVTIRIRSRGPESMGTVTPLPGQRARVVFQEPQAAVTPGQAAVFYQGDRVFGGGWIDNIA